MNASGRPSARAARPDDSASKPPRDAMLQPDKPTRPLSKTLPPRGRIQTPPQAPQSARAPWHRASTKRRPQRSRGSAATRSSTRGGAENPQDLAPATSQTAQ